MYVSFLFDMRWRYLHSVIVSQREQLEGSETAANIMGVMIESHLNEGKQSMPAEGPSG